MIDIITKVVAVIAIAFIVVVIIIVIDTPILDFGICLRSCNALVIADKTWHGVVAYIPEEMTVVLSLRQKYTLGFNNNGNKVSPIVCSPVQTTEQWVLINTRENNTMSNCHWSYILTALTKTLNGDRYVLTL